MRDALSTNCFIHKGRELCVEHFHDTDYPAPWEADDLYKGLVSDWTTNNKYPGQVILCCDRASRRYFDWQEAMKRARKAGDGGGLDTFMHLTAKLRRVPTRGQCAEASVEWMFNHLRGWCNDDWYYVGVQVTDVETGVEENLWGIESSDERYLKEVGLELAEDIYMPSIEHLILHGVAA